MGFVRAKSSSVVRGFGFGLRRRKRNIDFVPLSNIAIATCRAAIGRIERELGIKAARFDVIDPQFHAV